MLVGTTVYAACQWATLIVLTRRCSPAEVGLFAWALALAAPVLMLLNLQLRAVQVTDVAAKFSFAEYLTLRLWTTALALIVIVGAGFILAPSSIAVGVISLVGISKCLEAVSDGLYGHMQRHERLDLVAKSSILKGFISTACLTLAVALTGNVLWGACGLVMGGLLTLIIYDVPSCRNHLPDLEGVLQGRAPFRFMTRVGAGMNTRRLWELAWLAAPLGVVQMLASLSANLPRYFVEHYLGAASLGIFATLSYFIVVGQTGVSALGQAASARLAQFFANNEMRSFYYLLSGMAGVGLLMGLAGAAIAYWWGAPILQLIYPAAYAAHNRALVVIMAGAGVAYAAWFLGFGMTAAQAFRPQVFVLASSLVATGLACRVLVPQTGIDGAAMGLAIGMAVLALGSAVVVVQATLQARRRHSSLTKGLAIGLDALDPDF